MRSGRSPASRAGSQDTETVQTVTVVTGQTSTVSFTNKELPGLRIEKYDRVTQEAMAGVTFRIWRDGELLGDFTTGQLGEILLVDLDPGTYLVPGGGLRR